MIDLNKSKTIRILNRSFSVKSEYSDRWTKLERYLFIEIYNVIKDFYTGTSSDQIISSSASGIVLKVPVDQVDSAFFGKNQRRRNLVDAAEGLSKKQISFKEAQADGKYAFEFISMFPRIAYNPKKDAKCIYVEISNEVYTKMVPIDSFCQLDLRLISEFKSGNTVRLYEIFKSYSFRGRVALEFEELRSLLGFSRVGAYTEWKHFNAKVLKPAVSEVNALKEYDIEVSYTKERGSSTVCFTIVEHVKGGGGLISVMSLDAVIDPGTRQYNMIQKSYVSTMLDHCKKHVLITNEKEMNDWVTSDLINQQQKLSVDDFDFKHAINAISLQIREGRYSKPYAHKHLSKSAAEFNQDTYDEVKALEHKGDFDFIRAHFSVETLEANRLGYLK